MLNGVSLAAGSGGQPVVTKQGSGDGADRLRREAAHLDAARHPGLVELLDISDDGDTVTIELGQVVGRNLLDQPPLTAPRLSAVFASIAQTLTDLHGAGIAHANLGAEHVIIDRHFRPTLCGFGNSVTAEPDDAVFGLDVVALGRLLEHELARSIDESIVDERDPAVIGLLHISDLADSARGRTDITIGHVAHRLQELAGAHANPIGNVAGRALGDRIRNGLDGSRVAVAGAAAGVLIVVTAFLVWSAVSGPSTAEALPSPRAAVTMPSAQPETSGQPEAAAPAAVATSSTGPMPTLLQSAGPACENDEASNSASYADVDGDGCYQRWWRAGAVLVVGYDRYSLGRDGDEVLLGDWSCDGVATPALYEPDTGRVFYFEKWATDGTDISVSATAFVPGLASVEIERANGCDVLIGRGSAGTTPIAPELP